MLAISKKSDWVTSFLAWIEQLNSQENRLCIDVLAQSNKYGLNSLMLATHHMSNSVADVLGFVKKLEQTEQIRILTKTTDLVKRTVWKNLVNEGNRSGMHRFLTDTNTFASLKHDRNGLMLAISQDTTSVLELLSTIAQLEPDSQKIILRHGLTVTAIETPAVFESVFSAIEKLGNDYVK